VAVDLTAYLARKEPDPYLKQAFEFGLLEDFDHLYRYADLMHMLESKKAETIVDRRTEIMPVRPTIAEHRHPYDDVRQPTNSKKADPLSLLHVMTLVAAEQQTMNFYMNIVTGRWSRWRTGFIWRLPRSKSSMSPIMNRCSMPTPPGYSAKSCTSTSAPYTGMAGRRANG
jgi:hypothetical protein